MDDIFADCILFDFQAGLSLGSIDLGSGTDTVRLPVGLKLKILDLLP